MKIGVMTKARIGFAIGIGMLIGIAEAEACGRIELLRHYVAIFCLSVGGAGLLGCLLGQLLQGSGSKQVASNEGAGSEHALGFLKSLRYWGLILMVSTAGFYSRSALRHPRIIETESKAEVVFPPLQLQGLVMNGTNSSALINGQTLFIGEGIGNVQLLAVDGEHATVGLEGQTKVLSLQR